MFNQPTGRTLVTGGLRKEGEHEMGTKGVFKDHTNSRFGRLVAVRVSGRRRTFVLWRCRCDCGEEVDVPSGDLVRLHTKSCGCLDSDQKRARVGRKNPAWRGAGSTKTEKHVYTYKKDALLRGIEWRLTDDGAALLMRLDCFYCGAKPRPMKTAAQTIVRNGIDRIINTRGYEPENVVSCCTRCNTMKGSMGLRDFAAHIAVVSRKLEVCLG